MACGWRLREGAALSWGLLALHAGLPASLGADADAPDGPDCFVEFRQFVACCCEQSSACFIEGDVLRRLCCDHLTPSCPAERMKANKRAWANNTYFREVMDQALVPAESVYIPRLEAFTDAETRTLCSALRLLFPLAPSGEVPIGSMLDRGWIPGGRDGDDPSRFYPGRERLFQDLYQSTRSPYDGLAVSPDRAQGFDIYPSNAYVNAGAIKERVIRELGEHPKLVVEVGTFIGSGALVWGSLARELPPGEGLVICVDTWQGDLTMRLDPSYQDLANVTHGFPTFGRVFLERMLHEGMQGTVYPLPMPGSMAARLLYVLGYRVDVAYIDSAHERGETALELHLFYQLLRPGGLLMGDDARGFPGVAHDLQLFARCHNLSLSTFAGEQWVVRKPL